MSRLQIFDPGDNSCLTEPMKFLSAPLCGRAKGDFHMSARRTCGCCTYPHDVRFDINRPPRLLNGCEVSNFLYRSSWRRLVSPVRIRHAQPNRNFNRRSDRKLPQEVPGVKRRMLASDHTSYCACAPLYALRLPALFQSVPQTTADGTASRTYHDAPPPRSTKASHGRLIN